MASSRRPLEGETAIITGAGRGIGRAVALVFAGAGATVVLASRTGAELEKTAAEVRSSGGRAIPVPTDLTSKADVDALVAAALDATGRIDVVVNNAGVFVWRPFAELSEAEWDRVLGTNLKASYLLIHAALAALVKSGRGRVLNIASIHGSVGEPNVVAHCAAKFGLIGLTKALAQELRESGVSVNAIAPGATENKTRDMEALGHDRPLKEKVHAHDVAEAALFLASPAAAPISGAVLDIWGGTRVTIKS